MHIIYNYNNNSDSLVAFATFYLVLSKILFTMFLSSNKLKLNYCIYFIAEQYTFIILLSSIYKSKSCVPLMILELDFRILLSSTPIDHSHCLPTNEIESNDQYCDAF